MVEERKALAPVTDNVQQPLVEEGLGTDCQSALVPFGESALVPVQEKTIVPLGEKALAPAEENVLTSVDEAQPIVRVEEYR